MKNSAESPPRETKESMDGRPRKNRIGKWLIRKQNCRDDRSKSFFSSLLGQNQPSRLTLNGESLTLEDIRINGEPLSDHQFNVGKETLTIDGVPDSFALQVVTVINPSENKALEGLYLSNGRFCTQCEAEGFRRITYFLDRPDVLTRFRVEIRAEEKQYPILLSNGNLIDRGRLDETRHYCIWNDPFPKPCYLFALVAGDLACLNTTFRTNSKKLVPLNMFVEPGKESRAEFALDSLVRAMEWEERVYGLEYDLAGAEKRMGRTRLWVGV